MSVHTVGLNASDTTVRLLGPGEDMGEGDTVPQGQLAVVLTDHAGQYEVTVTGTAQTLRSLVYDGLSAPIPDGVPLMDEQPPVFLADPQGGGTWIPAPEGHTED